MVCGFEDVWFVMLMVQGLVQALREWVDRCIDESLDSWIGGSVEWWPVVRCIM